MSDQTRAEQPGFHCAECGHRHQGQRFGFICIGCPCQTRPAEVLASPVSGAPTPPEPETGLRQRIERLEAAGWAAWQDLHDWRRFAQDLRAKVADPDHSPLTPTQAGIDKTVNLIAGLGAALSAPATPAQSIETGGELERVIEALGLRDEHRAFVAVMNALDVHMPPDGARLLNELRQIAATAGYPWGSDAAAPVTPPPPVEPTTKTPAHVWMLAEKIAGELLGDEPDRLHDAAVLIEHELLAAAPAPVEPCQWRDITQKGFDVATRWETACGHQDRSSRFMLEQWTACHHCGRPLVILPTEPQA